MLKAIRCLYLTCITIALGLIIGCSQIPTTTSPGKIVLEKPQYSKIANDYINKAAIATNNKEKQDYKLKATENFILADDIVRAEAICSSIEITNQTQESYLYIVKAQIALHKKQLDVAHKHLQNIWSPKQLEPDLQTKFYQTRADLSLRSGNNIEAAKDHIQLEQCLTIAEDKIAEDKEIWTILSKLTPHDLQENRQQQTNDVNFTGWLNITYILKQYDSSPEQMSRAIAVWKKQYPTHSANNILPEQEDPYQQDLIINAPKHIALLLPLKGQYATTAEIIRDGFLTAHYENCKTTGCNTEVHIYDTSNDAIQAYKKALDEGADFIVGPLTKNDVERVADISTRDIPILALNTTHSIPSRPQANLFQFGLVPETDMTEIAEKVWHDAHRKVLLIVPAGDWGQRLTTHFYDEWKQRGGIILAIEKIRPKDDLSQKIRRLLAVTNSEERIKKLKKAGIKFNAEPKRRQDVDAIIIATTPELSRQLKPLFNFYYASNIPVYAHSSIYSGKPSSIQDQDLNDITFCDMPWLLDNSIISRSIYKNISTIWPDRLAKSPRLYAFGIDAYKIANQLHQLITMPDFGISGMTGILTIDKQHRIQRELMWAKFHDGLPRLLTTK